MCLKAEVIWEGGFHRHDCADLTWAHLQHLQRDGSFDGQREDSFIPRESLLEDEAFIVLVSSCKSPPSLSLSQLGGEL